MIRPFGLFLAAALLLAADPAPIGVWRAGAGSIDGRPAQADAAILPGQMMASGDAQPVRLEAHEAPACSVILAAGSAGRLVCEVQADGARHLVLDLERGAAQLDIGDKGPFAAVRVRGAACEVLVTGTLFVVERVRRDADYVALVRGQVQVSLKPDIAKALGQSRPLDLTERQGVQATAAGFAAVDALSHRPQLSQAAGTRALVQDQGTGVSGQGTTDWATDLAGQFTGLDGLGGGLDSIDFPALAEQLSAPLTEVGVGSASDRVQEQVLQSAPTATPAPQPLAGPPGHP